MTERKRTVVVTGAGKGIGRSTAEKLASNGWRVVGLNRSHPGDAFPGDLIVVDFADRDATETVLASVAEEYEVDALVNNVGLVRLQKLGEVSLKDFDAIIDVNVRAALAAAQAFVPGMRRRRWGRIVNVSSLVMTGFVNRTSYAAAKAALASMTRTWALELAPDGITSNCVAPGPTETELFRKGSPPGSAGEAAFLRMTPMGRIATPDDIAGAIEFFLSDAASFITGQTLFVDGGASVGRAGMS